jgi:2-oxoglutarate ferredoxin oxidoreductase subunit gamma
MEEKVIFSGSGGQGLMMIGKLFAHIMLEKSPHLTFFPSYGAEVRGGTSNCQVVLSDKEIASPLVDEASSLVLLNQPSVDRFLPALGKKGMAFINTSMAKAPEEGNVYGLPASDLALEAGSVRAANIVIFGAYLGRRGFLTQDEAREAIRNAFSGKGEKVIAVNDAALTRGWDYF